MTELNPLTRPQNAGTDPEIQYKVTSRLVKSWAAMERSALPPDPSRASEATTMRPQHQLAQGPAWQKINLPREGFRSNQLAELTHSELTDCSTQYNASQGNR